MSGTPRQARVGYKGQKWRTGSEGRISAAKQRRGLRRSRCKGYVGMQRWVGPGVIADKLAVDLVPLPCRSVSIRTSRRMGQPRF
jgi:hypothetical protein